MTTEYSGRGDAERTFALLWRGKGPPRRGPRPRLTVPRIVAAAIEIADSEGLEMLSMRRVAEHLGVGTMSLYTYVPGKHELIDIMLDTVLGELPLAREVDGDWRARLERVAWEDWALYQHHPWILQIAGHRPVIGPNTLAAYGAALETVSGLGLSDDEMVMVIDTVDVYVRGKAREAVDAAQAERRTGVSDHRWWSAQMPQWETYVDAGQYPALTDPSMIETIFGDHSAKFEFGLHRILDGIQSYLDSRHRS